jgi:diguanylate cyclase (GGDEF)-like protein/PAS domain S-box-containing protein
MTRDGAALITWVEDTITDVLGWRPDQLVGRPSTDYIHPEDQPSAVGAWFAMIQAPGEVRTWRGRYQTADGSWAWIEAVNRNRLDDAEHPIVETTIRRVSADQVSVEEELRARKQLLARLSDALPVGLFQFDAHRHLTFTNDRLQAILDAPAAATVEAQFGVIAAGDEPHLQAALADVLSGRDVDDLELRGGPAGSERVWVLSLRPLTDSGGAVNGAIGCVSDVTDRAQLRHELEVRASTDALTSCLNRRATLETLANAAAAGTGIAVVFVDLDGFKTVNDRWGHAVGDDLLAIVAERMRRAVRDGDRVGRVGGDEFLVVCPDVVDHAEAVTIGDRVSHALTTTVVVAGRRIDLQASVGVAWTTDPSDPDTLVARADEAMYQAKSGKARPRQPATSA